jgi:periplasmic protein CpxP/Spy
MGLVDHGINHVDPLKAARVFTKLYAADKPRKFGPFTFRTWATEMKESQMSTHDPIREMPASAPQRGVWYGSERRDPIDEITASPPQGVRSRKKRAYVMAAVAGGALVGAFVLSPAGSGLGHRVLASVPGMAAAAAPFEGGFPPGLVADWRSGLFDGAIEAVVVAHADRMIRHLAIEIDATTEQQDKLRAVVGGAVHDLLPMREKLLAARATARDLLTQQTIDRGAIEKFRADQIAFHDATSKRLVQAVADAAEILTPEQRRKLSNMMPPRGGPWGGGPWGRGPWGHWGGFGRN